MKCKAEIPPVRTGEYSQPCNTEMVEVGPTGGYHIKPAKPTKSGEPLSFPEGHPVILYQCPSCKTIAIEYE